MTNASGIVLYDFSCGRGRLWHRILLLFLGRWKLARAELKRSKDNDGKRHKILFLFLDRWRWVRAE